MIESTVSIPISSLHPLYLPGVFSLGTPLFIFQIPVTFMDGLVSWRASFFGWFVANVPFSLRARLALYAKAHAETRTGNTPRLV